MSRHSPCAPYPAPCRSQGHPGGHARCALTAACASNSAASAINSAAFAANSAEYPSNSAMLKSTSAEPHLIPPQSSTLDSAEFDADPAEYGPTSTEILTDRYRVTSPGYSSSVTELTHTKQVTAHFFGGGIFSGNVNKQRIRITGAPPSRARSAAPPHRSNGTLPPESPHRPGPVAALPQLPP